MRGQDVLLYENPYSYNPYDMNPKRRRRRHNPNIKSMAKTAGKYMFGGLNIFEMVGAIGGFALCAMVPGYIIKEPLDTELKKIGKIAVSVALAVAAKTLLHKWQPGVGKAALYGGIAGAGALALKIYSPTTVLINARNNKTPARIVAPPHTVTPAGGLGRNTNEEFTPAAII